MKNKHNQKSTLSQELKCDEDEKKINKYIQIAEKGWLSSQEAICIFSGNSLYDSQNPIAYSKIISSTVGRDLKSLVAAAEMDESVDGLHYDKNCLLYRASCRAWVDWALTKQTLQLEPELLEAVGIKTIRDKESYREQNELITKNRFQGAARIILNVCPEARLTYIREAITASNVLEKIPCDKTLRKWLEEEELSLMDIRPKKEIVADIKKKLALDIPPS